MNLKGKRISIRKLELEDVYLMRNWGPHKNPLLEDYNFPPMNDSEIKLWYKRKTNKRKNRYFAIENEENKLVGYMGIKDIKRFRKISTLGIVFDPNYINKGYGTETLNLFLDYYFTELNMKIILLEVAEFNKRAMKVYQKMGFKAIGYYLDEFFDSRLDLSSSYYIKEKSSFVIKDEKIYNYIYKMKLEVKDFVQLRQ